MNPVRCIPLVLALAVAAPLAAQDVGTPLPDADVEDLTQSEARSFDELVGRLLLIEFFAHW